MVAENVSYTLILKDDVQLKPERAFLLTDKRNYKSFDFLNLTLKNLFTILILQLLIFLLLNSLFVRDSGNYENVDISP
ncbi:hypothetical protein BHC57_00600 [Snodgrassella alvi]|uniref:Uncharacterized protein n=1 Tax=Snodgrassella alvi TaxID=1196083 RepID=A0A855FPI2_9NEIS|nr:hypothetical protein BHC57_00600 [Snodgrassella alvi]